MGLEGIEQDSEKTLSAHSRICDLPIASSDALLLSFRIFLETRLLN